MSSKDGIFVQHSFDYRAHGHITHLKAQNSNLIMVLNGRRVEHICRGASHNNEPSVVNIQLNGEDRIAHVHLDFSGTHAIISTTAGDNFYLCTKTLAVKPLRRLKSLTVSAVAWNVDLPRDGSTGFIVLGTTKGILLEACIAQSGAFTYFKNWENVFSGADKLLAITGLYFYQCSDDENKYFLLICMPGRLYALCESPNFGAFTQPLVSHPPVVGTVWSGVMVEQPSSAVLQAFFGFSKNKTPRYHCQSDGKSSMPSMLVVHPAATPNEPPTKYCWTTGEGMTVGRVNVGRRSRLSAAASDPSVNAAVLSDAYDIFEQEAILRHKRVEGRFDFPLDVVLTEHHLLVLYSGRVAVVSLLNQTVAFEENFSTAFSDETVVLGMCRDDTTEEVWLFSNSSIFYYKPEDETRYVWRYYLEMKEFGKARKITSQMRDRAPYQMVIKKEAEKFIADKNYNAAAELLAESTESFETIVQKFLADGTASRNGLKRFLELKLNQMDQPKPIDMIKRDILVIWLLEIQLSELAELRLNSRQVAVRHEVSCLSAPQGHHSESQRSSASPPDDSSSTTGELSCESELKKLREELYCFLNRKLVNESINANRLTVYRMMSTHVDFETQLHLATKLKDYDVVLKIFILQRQFADALAVLNAHPKAEFFYKYAPDLIGKIPGELVKVLLEHRRLLNVGRLLPTFYRCFENSADPDPKVIAATFFYLEEITGVRRAGSTLHAGPCGWSVEDRTVHSLLVHLYANYKPSALLDYLQHCGKRRPRNAKALPYNADYALRVCVEKNLVECSVFLLCVQNRYVEAVKLALTLDVELAKECAKELNEDEEVYGDEMMFSLDDDDEEDGDFGGVNGGGGGGYNPFDEVGDDFGNGLGVRMKSESEAVTITARSVSKARQKRAHQRKMAWMEIARYLISNGNDVEACMGLLKESNEALKIQDLLAHFPDFTCIEHFKEPLCECLKRHSDRIKSLQKEIIETTEMANEIRGELEKNKSKFMVVKTSDRCGVCKEPLMQKPFFAFLCRHFIHKPCLERLLWRELTNAERDRYTTLTKEERRLRNRLLPPASVGGCIDADAKLREAVPPSIHQKTNVMEELKRIQSDIQRLLADDCPLCGRRIIDAVDKPFQTAEEHLRSVELWSFE